MVGKAPGINSLSTTCRQRLIRCPEMWTGSAGPNPRPRVVNPMLLQTAQGLVSLHTEVRRSPDYQGLDLK